MEKSYRVIRGALAAAFLLALFSLPVSAAEKTVSVNDLINDSKKYDGQTVVISAEAIGECLERGDYAWINVNDGTNAIGIWMKREEAAEITYFGDYQYTGDTLEICGIYSQACEEHGGEPDIHAAEVRVVSAGERRQEEIPVSKIAAAAGCMAVGTGLLFLLRRILGKR